MFAVPGWSVSADSLKVEQEASTSHTSTGTKSRKRKRITEQQVTGSNVVDLYESVIETRRESKDLKTKKRKTNVERDPNHESKGTSQVGHKNKLGTDTTRRDPVKRKSTKDRDGEQQSRESVVIKNKRLSSPNNSPLPPNSAKLTPLQASMRDKLISARFRHLNEMLYTRPSPEALRLFQESPDMFNEYHEGFRRQVRIWPENPVDCFLADIRARAKIRTFHGPGKKGNKTHLSTNPLPRTAGTCIIADLGCGDARLAEALQTHRAKLKLEIKSYDLQSPNSFVTKADIANLPLEDASVNVAIFCLALMGTNWLEFIDEAHRILRWKGELWVAEIKSRFHPVRSRGTSNNSKLKGPVDHCVSSNTKDRGKKPKSTSRNLGNVDVDDDAMHAQYLAIEVDGVEDRRRETDVSAFVEALCKRGFVLDCEYKEAVDLSNRMFVKMHFKKTDISSKRKNVESRAPSPKDRKRLATEHRDYDTGTAGELDEASLLKPCVYKIR
ncbi:hypothetical protein CDD82_6110 [Ophiocordyceps australis]|uniref:Ribosomal RNA-processing protein 8 n=1 Tax=Ophiocordyceps australis TaxID=1399860 RepID=A0A2C5YYW9_9HYPO|nr:hypothetical protein CDD82_6110 [Ophiocordyceps australis]